jgi:tetratricopeptide (TPR) repeat protein
MVISALWMALGWSASLSAAGDFAGLSPGRSTISDAKRILGRPTMAGSAFQFSGDRFGASLILVEADALSGVLQSIAVHLSEPETREHVLSWFALEAPAFRETRGGETIETFLLELVELRLRDGRVAEIVHLAPERVAARLRRGIGAKLRSGDRKGVLADFARLRLISAIDPDTAFAIAERLHGEGDDGIARGIVEEGLRVAPDHEFGRLLEAIVGASCEVAMPGWLGVHMTGTTVEKVFDQTPAAEAGVIEGDDLIGIDGKDVVSWKERREVLLGLRVGQKVRLLLRRKGETVIAFATPIDRRVYFSGRMKPGDEWEAALVEIETGRIRGAYDRLKKAAAAKTAPLRLHFELCQAAQVFDFELGLKEWKAFYSKVDRETPQRWTLHAHTELRAMEEALPAFLKAKELDHADKFREAAAAYGKIGIECSNVYFRLGYCLKRAKEYGAAAQAFRTAVGIWLAEPVTLYNLGECYESFDLARATAASAEFARASEGEKRLDGLRDIARARLARAERALASKLLGDHCLARQLWSQAMADFESAAQAAPESLEPRWGQVLALSKMGRREEAERICRGWTDRTATPLTASMLAWLGDLECERGHPMEAAGFFRRAYDLAPDTVAHLYHAAWATEQADAKASVAAWQLYLDRSRAHPEEALRRQEAEDHLGRLKR